MREATFEINLKAKVDYIIEDHLATAWSGARREVLLRYDLEGLENQIREQVKQAILDQGLLLSVDDMILEDRPRWENNESNRTECRD